MALAEIYTDADEFSGAVLNIRGVDYDKPLVSKLGGGLLSFANAVFPGVEPTEIYAELSLREESKGPHFDIYGDYLDHYYPWVGIYNVHGKADVTTTPLQEDLASVYKNMYPGRTAEAGKARRHFGAIALGNPNAELTSFEFSSDIGMVLPQRINGKNIVHEVVPKKSSSVYPDTYVKIIRPQLDYLGGMEALVDDFGYKLLDELITEAMAGGRREAVSPTIIYKPPSSDFERNDMVETRRRNQRRHGLSSDLID